MSGVRIVPLLTAVVVTVIGGWTLTVQGAASPEREIVINVPAFRLTLFEDGEPLRSYPVGVGVNLKPSRLGATKIINEVHNPTYYPPDWWKRGLTPIPPGPENPVGTRWLGLGFSGYGIHGTNSPESIGKAVSSGCIRMHNEDVEELARLVGVGTPVRLVYDTIEVWSDAGTGSHLIQIHPDIYRMGTNRLELARRHLEAVDAWDEVDRVLLEEVVTNASGVPVPLSQLSSPRFIQTAEAPGDVLESQHLPDQPSFEAAEMIESYGYAAFPKRAVGLQIEGVTEVLVRTLIDPTGRVERVDVAKTSGFDLLDSHALRVAESTLRYKAYDQMYVINISVAYDVTEAANRRLLYEPVGGVHAPASTQVASALN